MLHCTFNSQLTNANIQKTRNTLTIISHFTFHTLKKQNVQRNSSSHLFQRLSFLFPS